MGVRFGFCTYLVKSLKNTNMAIKFLISTSSCSSVYNRGAFDFQVDFLARSVRLYRLVSSNNWNVCSCAIFAAVIWLEKLYSDHLVNSFSLAGIRRDISKEKNV